MNGGNLFVMRKKIFFISLFLILGLGYSSNGQNDPIDTEDDGGDGAVVGVVISCPPVGQTGDCHKMYVINVYTRAYCCYYTGNTTH